MKKLNAKGMGLVELLIGVMVLALFAQSAVLMRMVAARKAAVQADRTYAGVKGLQMMNELKAQADARPLYGGYVLDGFSDGAGFNRNLTADRSVSDPGDPLSGNRRKDGHWHYLRQIQVAPVPGLPSAREVEVRVWVCASNGNPPIPGLLLARVTGLIVPGVRLSRVVSVFSGAITMVMTQ